MYSKILIPLALDHEAVAGRALEAARALQSKGGTLTILTVIEPIPAHVAQYLPDTQQEKILNDIKTALRAEFGASDDITVIAQTGHAAQTILDIASDGAFDCVIIASHRPGLQDYFLGSTAGRVVRHAHCAVHVIR
jgi:nucleotide-binding universal stress UspA family protein